MAWLWCAAKAIASSRPPDFVIGDKSAPYLLRWHVVPRNPICNVYVHQFLRSDDDRALHDHPWASVSLLLAGSYTEHTINAGGVHERNLYAAGDVLVRPFGGRAHRVEIAAGETAWTLFITGPVYRVWGFHCPQGWVPWHEFTAADDRGSVGRGCGLVKQNKGVVRNLDARRKRFESEHKGVSDDRNQWR